MSTSLDTVSICLWCRSTCVARAQQEGGMLEAGERAGESRGSTRLMGMEVDKPEEENAFKFDEEDPRPEDRSAGEEEGEQAGREDEGEEGRRTTGMTAPMKLLDNEREEHALTSTHRSELGARTVGGHEYATRVISRTRGSTRTSPTRYRG